MEGASDKMRHARKSWRALILGGLLAATGAVTTGCIQTTGAPCETSADCLLGDLCLTEEDGFPGGYCTTSNCSEVGCDVTSECFALDLGGSSEEVCLALCDINGECSRDDYDCFDIDGTNVCLPGEGVGQGRARSGEVGASCTADSACESGGAPVCLRNLPNGYCSALCDGGGDCPSGSHCELLGDQGYCYQDCNNNDDCRFGYQCSTNDLSEASCVPDDGSVVKNPDGRDDGEPCVSDINCKGGVCIREAEGFPGGYCSTLFCDDNDGCNGGVCVNSSSNNVCRASCEEDSDCRDEYMCVKSGNEGYCNPVNQGGGTAPSAGGELQVECQSGDSIQFDVPAGSVGFYIAPFNRSGDSLVPTRLQGNGVDLNLTGEYGFYSLNPQILVSIAPLLFPGSDMRALEGGRTDWGGSWTMDFDTRASEVCYYIVDRPQPGTKIDVNFYLVGVPGVNAGNAGSNSNFQSMIETMRTIYAKADIQIGEVRYNELSSEQTSQYRIIRDFFDGLDLVTLSKDPGSTRDELLSVNVFLIEDFNIPDLPGLLGFSPGLPGVSGAHGSAGAGLVFSSVNLRNSPSDLGQTMAHEIGHFLGLRHTSEHGGNEHDPISDTDECSDPQNGTRCPDHRNFMFPFSLSGVRQENVSDGQKFVLQRSALVK
jgi:hypothetical protein